MKYVYHSQFTHVCLHEHYIVGFGGFYDGENFLGDLFLVNCFGLHEPYIVEFRVTIFLFA